MDLSSYIDKKPRGERARIARAAGVDYTTVWRIETRRAAASADLAARISAETGGVVTVAEILYPEGLPTGAVVCSACCGTAEMLVGG